MVEAAPQPWQHQSKTLLGQQHGIQISQENSLPDNCDKCIMCQSYLKEKSPLFPTISEYDICYEDSIKTFLTVFNCTVPMALSIFTLFSNQHQSLERFTFPTETLYPFNINSLFPLSPWQPPFYFLSL